MTDIEKIRQEIERRKDYISVTHFAEELLAFIDSLLEEKPSLPSNLDDAANSYASKTECAVVACRGFKTGAEWMAKQGLISEGIIYQTSGKDTTIELNEHIGYLEDCDEVIVNIRKKQ